MRGSERVDLAELLPGASYEMHLLVRPSRSGTFVLSSSNFSFRDASDQPRRVRRWQATVFVEMSVLSARQRAAARASEFAQARRWDHAWRMYLAAGLADHAQDCLSKAVAELGRLGHPRDVADQYVAYARQLRDAGDPSMQAHPELIKGLAQAVEQYLRAGQPAEANQCHDLLCYLTEAPLLELKVVIRPGTTFVVGRASLVAIEVSNRGYGPAYAVHLTLSGAVEPVNDQLLDRLGQDKTSVWEDACVVPSYAGECVVEVHADAVNYRGQHVSPARHRTKIQVAERSTAGESTGQGFGEAHYTIGNFLGAGAINVQSNDIGAVIVRSNARQVTATQHDPAPDDSAEPPAI